MSTRVSVRALRVEAIAAELKRHGIPLHWETIAVMLQDKRRTLFGTAKDVVETLALHPERFRSEGNGVFGLRESALQEAPRTAYGAKRLSWPDEDTAFFLGALCARGTILPEDDSIRIGFRYGGKAYTHNGRQGFIGKGRVSFRATDVVPQVPKAVVRTISGVVTPAKPKIDSEGVMHFSILVDCYAVPRIIDDALSYVGPGTDYSSFVVPAAVVQAGVRDRKAFLRGFAQVCGLASAGTNLWGGTEQVWLRPDTKNKPLFYQLMDLIRGLQIPVYWNDRDERDISIKINCEDWLGIGFGIDWIDAIVREGARLNRERKTGRAR